MDFYTIKYKLQSHNYNLYKLAENQFSITKNEHGTYDEFYDFSINITIDTLNSNIQHWNIYIQNPNNNSQKNQIEQIIKQSTTLFNLCDKLCYFI